MKRWGIFLTLLVWLFSFSNATANSLEELLNKLEDDLRAKAPVQTIQEDLSQIRKAKEKYSVYYLPELNYLLKKEVEPVPTTKITLLKRVTFHLEPLKRAVEVLVFFLLFYTFIFYTQHIDLDPEKKRYLTLILILVLAVTVLLNYRPGFYFLTGMGTVLAFSIKKKKTATFLLMAGIFSIFTVGLTQNFLSYLKSPQLLYGEKVSRDGYAPPFLIREAIKNPLHRKVELITIDLALGELQAVKELQNIKTRDPYLLGIIYNDLGYAHFLSGNYKKALKAFLEANKYVKSPIVYFNLYITYSSLLMLDKAKKIRKELLKEGIDASKASPVPLLIHVKTAKFKTTIPYLLIIFFGAGLIVGLLFDRAFGFYAEQLSSGVLQIPGMMSFINSRLKPFIIIFLLTLIANYVLGKAICNT